MFLFKKRFTFIFSKDAIYGPKGTVNKFIMLQNILFQIIAFELSIRQRILKKVWQFSTKFLSRLL